MPRPRKAGELYRTDIAIVSRSLQPTVTSPMRPAPLGRHSIGRARVNTTAIRSTFTVSARQAIMSPACSVTRATHLPIPPPTCHLCHPNRVSTSRNAQPPPKGMQARARRQHLGRHPLGRTQLGRRQRIRMIASRLQLQKRQHLKRLLPMNLTSIRSLETNHHPDKEQALLSRQVLQCRTERFAGHYSYSPYSRRA